MEKTQREYYLNEQMKAIQKELGDGEEGRDELAEIEDRIKNTKLSKEAREKAEGEFKKVEADEPDERGSDSGAQLSRLAARPIPWGKKSRVKTDLNQGREEVLDADHTVWRRSRNALLNISRSRAASNKIERPDICAWLALPASARRRLASRLPRQPAVSSCACRWVGVRDEAEIRGHRRTYIGSMPGKVIQSMKKAKKN